MGLSTTTGMPAFSAAVACSACAALAEAITTKSNSVRTSSSIDLTTTVFGKSALACPARTTFVVRIATTSNPQPLSSGA